jgi:hypothetical protein
MPEAAAVSPPDVRRAARRGLVVFLGLVVVLSGTIEAIWIMNPTMGILVIPLMWSPAVASVIVRLLLRACYELGQKSHRNADFTVSLVPSRSLFPAFLSRF